MSTLYEYYNTGGDAYIDFSGEVWRAQTFTPATAHKITSVKLQLCRVGLPGIITVSIRATDGAGHPTGEDLCSGTIDGDTLPTTAEWREITLGAGYNLSADTKYAIVVRAPSGDTSNYIYLLVDTSSPTYAGGVEEYSTDSGLTWTADTTVDCMFEEWGEPAIETKTKTYTLASRLISTKTKTYTLSARLLKTFTKTCTLAARLIKTQMTTCTLAAKLIKRISQTYTLGARITVKAPTVVTHEATDIQTTQMTLHGEITNVGWKNCTERGFDWGIVQGGPYPYSWLETGDFGVGAFEHTITGLDPGTTYYFRAKASHA